MNVYVNQKNGYAKLVLIDRKVIPQKPRWMPQSIANLLGKYTNLVLYTVRSDAAVYFNRKVDYKKTIIDHIVFDHYNWPDRKIKTQ